MERRVQAQGVYAFARDAAIEVEGHVHEVTASPLQDASLHAALQGIRQQSDSETRRLEALGRNTLDFLPLTKTDPATRLWYLRVIRDAYIQSSLESPILPKYSSPLPDLLALRSASGSNTDTRAAVPQSQAELSAIELQLRDEQGRLRAYALLASALRKRTKKLRKLAIERKSKGPVNLLEAAVAANSLQQNTYVDEGDQLLQHLSVFVSERLAPMFAAEDLGGPALGDLQGISDHDLGVGFTNKGKPKKAYSQDATATFGDEGRRYRTIASKDVRQLVKRLLRAFEDDPDKYIGIEHENATSRFLVQANVAEMDPHDAHQIRLLNILDDDDV